MYNLRIMMTNKKENILLWLIGVGLLLPVFFSLQGGIYSADEAVTDSGGVLSRLPVPIAMVTCIAIFLFWDEWRQKIAPGFMVILGTLIALLASILAGDSESSISQRKLLLAVQVLLPMCGLCLGLLVHHGKYILAKAFLVVLSVIVPCQLLATWIQGRAILTHDLYIFSIYSHFQYVPVVFICAYFYSFSILGCKYKSWFYLMSGFMFIYAIASMSFLAIFAFITFQVMYFSRALVLYRNSRFLTAGVFGIFVCLIIAAGLYSKSSMEREVLISSKQGMSQWLFQEKYKRIFQGEVPRNVEERFEDWKLFGGGIVSSRRAFFLGHAEPMPREIRSSPHNWYIDVAYNFGVLSLLPILALICFTIILMIGERRKVGMELYWLAFIVAFLVLVDSNFKVTLRQPYPGIFSFFLWGLLISSLRSLKSNRPVREAT